MALLLAGAASLLSVLLGWAVALGNARARHKSLVTVVCSLLFLALYYAGFLKVQSLLDELAADAAQLGTALQQGSGPLYVLGRAAMGDLPALAGLAVGVLLGTAGVFRLLENPYLRRMTAQHGTPKAVYHAVRTKAVSLRRALLRRELRHLGSSAAYLLNASLGTLLLPVLGAAALWKTPALRAFVHGTLPGTAAFILMTAASFVHCRLGSSRPNSSPSSAVKQLNSTTARRKRFLRSAARCWPERICCCCAG